MSPTAEGFRIASAYVQVSPDSTGFKEELKEQVDEAVASAGQRDDRQEARGPETAPKSATAAAGRDLAESQRRAAGAKTPIAKAVTRRVVERKLAMYTPEAAAHAAALRGGAPCQGVARRTGKGTRAARKGR